MAGNRQTLVGKYCIKCGKVLPLGDFAMNKEWKSQSYHDIWCKECAKKSLKTKEDVARYCYENNRHWEDKYWEACKVRAQKTMSTSDLILKATDETKRQKAAIQIVAQTWLSIMNNNAYYQYEDHDEASTTALNNPEAQTDSPETSEKPKWDKTWRGYYTDSQIREQTEAFDGYVKAYGIDMNDLNLVDSTRKLLKASMNADIADDRFRRGEINMQECKAAHALYEEYSKMTTFAACVQAKNKVGVTDEDSLGMIIERLESTGLLGENNYTFEPDQVDMIISDFRHTIAAVGTSIGGYE